MYKIIIQTIITVFFLTHQVGYGAEQTYICGISNGYPPYQFNNNKKEVDGFDADVLRLIFSKTNNKLTFQQMNWNNVVGELAYSDRLNCAAGMEVSKNRKKLFDFTTPYYSRKISIFILSDNTTIKKLEDLVGKKVTGDRDSSIEVQLESMGLKGGIRLKATKTKEESMKLLKAGTFVAMIAPRGVGLYLAKKLEVKVKILEEFDHASPVGIAVKKGDLQLLNMLNYELNILLKEGEIKKLYQKWFE
jgi:polar amino acid transport system substrate-binding protein